MIMTDKPGSKTTTPTGTTKAGTPRKKAEPKVLAPLDMNAIVVSKTTPEMMREGKRIKVERDKHQKAVDSLVLQAHKAWTEAGKPEAWEDQPGLHLKVPAAQWESLETRVRRAGAFYTLAIRFGDRKERDGYTEVVLVVKDRSKRESKGEAGKSEPEPEVTPNAGEVVS